MTQHKLLADFNRYFTSSNGVDVPARVSVPRDEWRALFAALSEQGAGEAVAYTVAGDIKDWSRDFSKYKTQHYVRPVYTRPQAAQPARVVDAAAPTPSQAGAVTELEARQAFESLNTDSFGFSRSVRGTYKNPPIARDWKWFNLGIEHALKGSK